MASKIDIKRKKKDDNKRKIISIDEYKRKKVENVGPAEGLKRLAIPQPPDACYDFGDTFTSKKAKKSGSSKKSSSTKLNCANNSFTSSFCSSTMISCSNNLASTPSTLSSLTMPSPKNLPCPLAASPCDSGLGSIASSPVRAQTTPINTHNLPNFSPPPVPLPIIIPLERTNSLLDKTKKQRIPTSISDPRRSKLENSTNPGKPSVHVYSASKNHKENILKLKKLKMPTFANSRQVKQLFLRIRQSHQLNNQNEVDPLFSDPIYAFPVTDQINTISTTKTDQKSCAKK